MPQSMTEILAAMNDGTLPEGSDVNAMLKTASDTAINSAVSTAVEKATNGLSTKNDELLGIIKGLKDSAVALPDDFDQELYDTMLKDHKDKEAENLRAEERWDELRQNLETKHAEDMDAANAVSSGLESALSAQLIDNAATTQILAEKGSATLLLPHIKANLKMVHTEQGYSTIVVDRFGKERPSLSKAGEMMSISELVNEFKANEQFAGAFMAPNSGGGASGSGAGGASSVKNPFKRGKDYSLTNQARLVKTNPELATKLKAAATA